MHTHPLLTGAIALTLWAPQAAAQDSCCTSSQKASPVTVRLLDGCQEQGAKASPVARAASSELGRIFGESDTTQDEAVRTLAALGYVADNAEAAAANERGYLGVVMDVEDGAMIVRRVMDGSPAAKAGLKAGDRITRLGDHKVKNQESLTGFLQGLKAGRDLELRVVRDGWVKEMGVALAPLSSIQVDESPLEEIEEEPVIEDFEIVELTPANEAHGEWIEKDKGDAFRWVTTLKGHDGKDKPERLELKGHGALIELEDITGLEGLGIDLEGLGGLAELHVMQGGDVDVESLKKRIHEHLMKELGTDGKHEVEIHVEHDGDGHDLEDLKQKIKTRVKKQLGSELHPGHDASHGEHEVRVRLEHLGGEHDGEHGDVRTRVRGKMIVIDGDGEKHEFDLGDGGAHSFEWDSRDIGSSPSKNIFIMREGGDGPHRVQQHKDGKVMLFGGPEGKHRIEVKGFAGAPSKGFFFSDDDDDDDDHEHEHEHDGDDDDDHHDGDDDDEHHGRSVERHVIERTTKAPGRGSFIFDIGEDDEDAEDHDEDEEVMVTFGDGEGGSRIIRRLPAPQVRRGTLLGSGHDETIGKLREELSRLREEIARLREAIQKMHR